MILSPYYWLIPTKRISFPFFNCTEWNRRRYFVKVKSLQKWIVRLCGWSPFQYNAKNYYLFEFTKRLVWLSVIRNNLLAFFSKAFFYSIELFEITVMRRRHRPLNRIEDTSEGRVKYPNRKRFFLFSTSDMKIFLEGWVTKEGWFLCIQ